MSRTSRKLLALSAAVVALCAWASTASADTPVIYFGPLCGTAPAHATISVNGPVTSATSPGNAYFYSPQGLCYRYVVNISSPPNTPFTIWVEPTQAPGGQALCNALAGQVEIYRRGLLQTSYTQIHSGHLKGKWDPGDGFITPPHCSLVEDSAGAIFSPDWYQPKAGYSTSTAFGSSLRVAVGLKLSDWVSVKVSVAPNPDPPIIY